MAAALRPAPCAVHIKIGLFESRPSVIEVPCTNDVRLSVHSVNLAMKVRNIIIREPTDRLRLDSQHI